MRIRAPHERRQAATQATSEWIDPHGMDDIGLRRPSRDRIRLRYEVVRRIHAADTRRVYGCHRFIECLSSLAGAPHTSRRNGVRRLDRYRRRRYRGSGYRSAGRLCVAGADALHRFDCGRRDRIKTCFRKLRMPLEAFRGDHSVAAASPVSGLVHKPTSHSYPDLVW